jgi:hypothetical protein
MRYKVCYRRETGRYMLSSRFTAPDPKPKANHTNLQQIGSLTPRRVGARAVLVPLSNREAIWDTVDDAVLHYEIYRGGGADIGDGIA